MSIFRQQALDRIASPERLDEALVAAAPRHWIAFTAIAALTAAAVAWGFLGSVPTRISAEGILLTHDSEIFSAAAEGDGQLSDILVAIGTQVEKGQEIAVLKQDVTEAKLARAEEALIRAQERLDVLYNQREEDIAQNDALDIKRKAATKEKLANGADRVRALEARLAANQALLDRGYANKITIHEIENELAQVREKLTELRYKGLDIEAEARRLREDWRKQILDQQSKTEDRRETVDDLKQVIGLSRTVKAPIAGTVTEIAASLGDVVSTGTPIVRIASHGSNEDALLFVSPREGKRIRQGYSVNVEPSVVKKEEVGTALGKVQSVSDLPVSAAAIQAMLHNEKLVEQFSSDGPPVLVRAHMLDDPSTPSRLAWTSGRGPAFAIEPGTMVAATITVREQAPVTLILPFLKSVLGLGG